MTIFRERLKEQRIKKGWSTIELASHIQATQPSIVRWENGSRVPNIESLKKLAIAFDVSADYLLGLED